MASSFKSAVRWLRHNFPVEWRVVVKLHPRYQIRNPDDPPEYVGHDGICRFHTNSFTILVADDMPLGMQIVTLDHEWAHVMKFPKQVKKFHTKAWERAIGRVAWERAYGAISAARERSLKNP